jgi:argininosuccinate lyase
MSTNSQQMWGGRFSQPVDELVAQFSASVAIDKKLAVYDITGSKAHAKMLAKVGVLTQDELQQIEQGLTSINEQINQGKFDWQDSLEDVHMNIEAALVNIIGDTGKKLHTGRSRNDQVATDMRLYLRDGVDQLLQLITVLQQDLLNLAEREAATVMPGFTHLQIAQPVTFGHHMMAWHSMLERDYERLVDARKRINRSPLGCAALAGTSYPIDREYTAKLLGFDSCISNSLDAVSDRDFVIEFISAATMLLGHLSRWSEELILWTCPQFNFISLPDAVCTGSSIMPQKKNPDVPELVRGKSSRVLGHLVSLVNLMKAQPLAYNRDNQEDKYPLFDSLETSIDCLQVYSVIIKGLEVNSAALTSSCQRGFINATDLADYLVVKGVAFRDAHEIVGKLVSYAIEHHCALEQIPLEVMQQFSPLIAQDVFAALDLDNVLAARAHMGATAPSAVQQAIKMAKQSIHNRQP